MVSLGTAVAAAVSLRPQVALAGRRVATANHSWSRLRSLLEHAAHSELTVEQQTDIEKLLLAFWADKLQLPKERLVETLDELRKHPSAGEHVSRVEKWLHSRDARGNGSVARELLASLGWNKQ